MKLLSLQSLKIIFVATALGASCYAFADTQEQVDLTQTMKQACQDKDEGDVCDFTNSNGNSINGSCKRSGSADGKLSCVPNN